MTLYECGIRYEKVADNGFTKKVTELYLVDACSFAEAEGRITKEMEPYISGDFDVVTIKRTNYSEIVENGADSADKWFKAKLIFITLEDEVRQGEENGCSLHRKGNRHQQCPCSCCRAHEDLSHGLRDCHA